MYSNTVRNSSRNIIAVVLLSSLASLICFGILGFGRGGESSYDTSTMYAAGRCWLDGRNPYNYDELSQSVAEVKGIPKITFFAYPPQSAALFITLALFSYPFAKIALLLLNLFSIAAIVAMTIYSINRYAKKNQVKVASWLIVAFIIGNPFTTTVVWMGQTSLITCAATMAAWLFSRHQKWVVAGICLGLASFKPQICVLFVVWFLLERNWKTLAVAIATAGVLSIYPMLVQGPINMLLAWHEELQYGYKSALVNALGTPHVVGLESLLYAAGLKPPSLDIFGLVLVVILWLFRHKIKIEDVVGILMVITVTFVYAHDYDYVCLIPIFTSLWLYCHTRRQLRLAIIPLGVMLFLPQLLERTLGFHDLNHSRTVVVLIFMLIVVVLSIRERSKHELQKIPL